MSLQKKEFVKKGGEELGCKLFDSLFNKKEPGQSTSTGNYAEFAQPETKNIASLEVAFVTEQRAWVDLNILTDMFDPFEIRLNLFLTAFAEIMYQLSEQNEAKQLLEYIREIVSLMIDSPLNPEDRLNILGPYFELLPVAMKNQIPKKKMTAILQISTPGNIISTDFIFSLNEEKSFLATCIILILQDLIYSLDKKELQKIFKAVQAMDAFYQAVKNFGDASTRKEAPAYAKRSLS